MNRRFLLASALGLLIPGIGLAQSNEPHGRPGGGQGGGRPPGSGGGAGGGQGGGRPPSGSGPPPRPNPGGPPPRPTPKPPPRPPGGHRPPPPRPGRPPPLGPHRPGSGRPPGFRPIRGPRWRYPRGYRYRRWTIGLMLPSLFLTPGYYYEDYWRMGLEGPPWGYRWVRYGPDLLLVDTRTGRIDDAIYGAFY
ncbi:RcnB family protein [Caulobacter rhizosphaerae]|uniref:Nickel/cobalt transporter regulator n=1 Tax=Caulobacter rhizosphaerae TaxID=2010972 RepID=A0ABU1MV35_9CAUL|nr:RcnB family protein [Caulobacter rhizosphaerae]MDR6530044.1 hypothetical protein [Caulobacter rhizosphaerae]GGL44885.1 hypothetical protein GCM10010983_47790 [Caulobacter rhizosphaerae]